jgi:hypothetical protein
MLSLDFDMEYKEIPFDVPDQSATVPTELKCEIKRREQGQLLI